MLNDTQQTTDEHTDKLEIPYRHLWGYAVVVVEVIGITGSWWYLSSLNNNLIWWGSISVSVIVIVNWWFWAAIVISKLVRDVQYEQHALFEISTELKQIQQMVYGKETSDKNCKEYPAVDSCTEMKK